jgi:hypothetical protein
MNYYTSNDNVLESEMIPPQEDLDQYLLALYGRLQKSNYLLPLVRRLNSDLIVCYNCLINIAANCLSRNEIIETTT